MKKSPKTECETRGFTKKHVPRCKDTKFYHLPLSGYTAQNLKGLAAYPTWFKRSRHLSNLVQWIIYTDIRECTLKSSALAVLEVLLYF